MAVKVFSCMNFGLEGKLVEVEVDILRGISSFSIVGLGDSAVQESKERIRSAIKNSSAVYPQQKKIVNLAPANLRKHGPQFDLPMAIGLLGASGQLNIRLFSETLVLGELALDGAVRPVCGILTAALFARQNGWKKIIIPKENFREASLVKNIEIFPIEHLREITSHNMQEKRTFQTRNSSNKPKNSNKSLPGQTFLGGETRVYDTDFSDIKGQEQAKRALMIAAAGGHHICLSGSPGVGKTLLAKALPSILPPLNEDEMFEVMQIHSAAGLLHRTPITARPFRRVHPSCTSVALTGGGSSLKPGEISLAHRGVLFLDELPEFKKQHLEHLRQPLEEKEIHISRSQGTVKYPAQFTLVAGMNPCPCGYFGDPQKECVCRPYQVIQYQKKISGPVMDRIDLFVELQRPPARKYQSSEPQKSSSSIKKQVQSARQIQQRRFTGHSLTGTPTKTNSEMTPKQLQINCPLTTECQNLLAEAADNLKLSGRQYHQTIKIARTIADLNSQQQITPENIAEALQYRKKTTLKV